MQTVQQQINPADGVVRPMGEGIFVICQRDDLGKAQNAVLTGDDLKRLMEAQ